MAATFQVWLALFVMIAVTTEFTGAADREFNLFNPGLEVYIDQTPSNEEGVFFKVTSPAIIERPAISEKIGAWDFKVYYFKEMSIFSENMPNYEPIYCDLCVAMKFSDMTGEDVEIWVPLYGQEEDDSENGGRPLIDSPIPENQLNGDGISQFRVDIAWMENALTETSTVSLNNNRNGADNIYIGSPCNIEMQALTKISELISSSST